MKLLQGVLFQRVENMAVQSVFQQLDFSTTEENMSSPQVEDLFGSDADEEVNRRVETITAKSDAEVVDTANASDEDAAPKQRKARRVIDDDEDEDDDGPAVDSEGDAPLIAETNGTSDKDEPAENSDDNADDDLFGGQDDASDADAEEKGKGPDVDGDEEPAEYEHPEQEYLEEEVEEDEIVAEVDLPELPMPKGKDGHLYYAKLPNFLTVEATAFNPDKYEVEGLTPAQSQDADVQERHDRIKLKVENTLRWRNIVNEDGQTERQSNARFIRWSDGSLTLQLGEEMFSVSQKPLTFRPPSTMVPGQTKDAPPTTYLVAQHQSVAILQSHGHLHAAFSFLPTSMSSLTHRRLTAAIAGRHTRNVRTKMVRTEVDPESIKAEAEAKAMDKLRRERREEAKRMKRAGGDDDDEPLGGVRATRLRRDEALEAEEDERTARAVRRNARESYADDDEDGFIVDDDEEEDVQEDGEDDDADADADADEDADADADLDVANDMDVDEDSSSRKRKFAASEANRKPKRRAVISDDEE